MSRTASKADSRNKWQKSSHWLRLYVAGSSPRSLRAVQNVKRMCEAELAGHYNLEVIDVYKQPLRVIEDQIIALPTLIKQAPGALCRLIGDMSETAQLRHGLGI